MAFIFEIPYRAAADPFLPRVLGAMFLPMLIALAVWGALFWACGDTWLNPHLYLLAALLGLLHFAPLFNFLATVYMGLAFTHYGLARLDELRIGRSA